MLKVRDIMTSPVVTAGPDATFPVLVDLLVSHRISALPIVDADDHLLGIVTEADLLCKEAYGGRRRRLVELLADLVAGGITVWALKGKGRTAKQLMTTHVVTAAPGDSVRVLTRHMVEEGRKRVPVVEDRRVVGIVSRTDVLRILHRSDDELAADVAGLLADPLRAPDGHEATGSVSGGVVTLRGTVRFPMDRPVLTAMVWQLPGVADVVDETTAREPDPEVAVP